MVAAWGWLCCLIPHQFVGQYLWSFLTELDEFRMDLVGGWFNCVENLPASAVEIIEHGKGYMQ